MPFNLAISWSYSHSAELGTGVRETETGPTPPSDLMRVSSKNPSPSSTEYSI